LPQLPKDLLLRFLPIIIFSIIAIIFIKSLTTVENQKDSDKIVGFIVNPIGELLSSTYDIISVQFPSIGSQERRHKVIREYQEEKISKITAPLQTLKEQNNTIAYNAMRQRYQKRAFTLAKDRGSSLVEIEGLLKSGLDVNMQDEKGRTLLFYATSAKNEYLVRKLIKAGADRSIKDYVGILPIDLVDKEREQQLYISLTIDWK